MIKFTAIIPTYKNTQGAEYLKKYFEKFGQKALFINNSDHNLGFAGAVNKGADKVKAKWLLILNDDIEFSDQNSKFEFRNPKQFPNSKFHRLQQETIIKLLAYAQKHKLDAVSPVLKALNGEIENTGYRVLSYGKIKLNKSKSECIDGLTAACLIVKTKVFRKLGGFDEKFFAYLEDVDFFIRFNKAGYKLGIAENLEVLHKQMVTSKTMGNFKARQDLINWWRLYFKHPDKFKFDLRFLLERLRNLSGFIKASIKAYMLKFN